MDCSCQLYTPRGSVHKFPPYELIHPLHTTLSNIRAVRIFLLTLIRCVPDFLTQFSSSSSSRHLPSSAFHLDLVKEMIGEVSYPIVPSFVRLQLPHTGSRPVEWRHIMSRTPFCHHTSWVPMLSLMAVFILHFPLISLLFSAFRLLN
jgi:hypothetical protein